MNLGTFIFKHKYRAPYHSLYFMAGSFLFMLMVMADSFHMAFLQILLFFESFILIFAYRHPTKVKVFSNEDFLSVKSYYLYGRAPKVAQYEISRLRDLHLLKAAEDSETRQIYYALCFSDHRNFSKALFPSMKWDEIDKAIEKLSPHIPELGNGASDLEERYYSIGQIFSEYAWIGAFALLLPVVGSIGFAAPDTSDSPSNLPVVLNERQQSLVQSAIAPECEGKEHCIIGFFASWCSTSQSSQPTIQALKRYFRGSSDVGVIAFQRQSLWGQGEYQKDEWQRDLQRILNRDISVPSFAVVRDGYLVEGSHIGGTGGSTDFRALEKFLREPLQAEQLIRN